MLLTGDHNLGSDGNLVPNKGFCTAPFTYAPDFKVALGTNFVANAGVGWLPTMHAAKGNIALADGSVLELTRIQLHQALMNSGDSVGGSSPFFPNPPWCFGANINRIQFP